MVSVRICETTLNLPQFLSTKDKGTKIQNSMITFKNGIDLHLGDANG